MKDKILILAFLVSQAGFSSQAHAQHSRSNEGVHRMIGALKSSLNSFSTSIRSEINALSNEVELQGNYIRAQMVCSGLGKIFSPNDASSDENGCIGSQLPDISEGWEVLVAEAAGPKAFFTPTHSDRATLPVENYKICILTYNDVWRATEVKYNGAGGCKLERIDGEWVLSAKADKSMGTLCKASCL